MSKKKMYGVVINGVRVGGAAGADTFASRFFGLMPQKTMDTESGLILRPCRQVHMFFMRYPLDIVFVSRSMTVVGTVTRLMPWRLSPSVKDAEYTVELCEGTVEKHQIKSGDGVIFRHEKGE